MIRGGGYLKTPKIDDIISQQPLAINHENCHSTSICFGLSYKVLTQKAAIKMYICYEKHRGLPPKLDKLFIQGQGVLMCPCLFGWMADKVKQL